MTYIHPLYLPYISLQFAVGYGTPIMDAKWIYRVWEERNVLGVKATDEKMV